MESSTKFISDSNNIEKNSPAYGIDLGTTNSCIGIVGNSEIPSIIELDDRKVTMPSCVLWDGNKDEFIVGEEAYKQRYKPNACYSVKRLMGSGEIVKFVHGKKRISKSPAEVSSIILKGLIKKASTVYKDIKDVVITVPADFKTPQIKDTLLAAEMAGLNVLNIMKEPTAASLVYKLDKKPGTVLVYDLGGGTFDVSIVNITKSNSGKSSFLDVLGVADSSKDVVTVLATKGNSKLGGDDLDRMMWEVVENKLSLLGCPVSKIKDEDREKLTLKLENLKKIDNFLNFTLKIDFTLKTGIKFTGDVVFTRDDYIYCTRKLFNLTKPYINDVIKMSKLNISSIVLVGGSTKNEHLRKMITDEYPNVDIYKYLNPDESVALGAAIQAKRLKFGSDTLEIFDVISNPIGIRASNKVIRLIDKNQSIPYSNQKMFSTMVDDQKSVSVEVYEGTGMYPCDNTYLGNLVIEDLPKGKAGTVGVIVQLGVDSSGLLICKAKHTDGEWKEAKLVNILGKTVEVENKGSAIKYEKWFNFANSLDEPKRSELISLIEAARVQPYAQQSVIKFIRKCSLEK